MTRGTLQVLPAALTDAGWALAGLAAEVTAVGRAVESAVDEAAGWAGDPAVEAALTLYRTAARQVHHRVGDALADLAGRATVAAGTYEATERGVAASAGAA